MSIHKTVDANNVITSIYSDGFTADVNLNATFHASAPLLGGTVDNFQGNAVDPDWEVTFVETAASGGTVTAGRTTTASGDAGAWTATSYGEEANARPTGIFGGFSAHFSDGHAAGAYATRKD